MARLAYGTIEIRRRYNAIASGSWWAVVHNDEQCLESEFYTCSCPAVTLCWAWRNPLKWSERTMRRKLRKLVRFSQLKTIFASVVDEESHKLDSRSQKTRVADLRKMARELDRDA